MDLPPLIEPHQPPSNADVLDKICGGGAGLMGLCTGIVGLAGTFFARFMLTLPGSTAQSDAGDVFNSAAGAYNGLVTVFAVVFVVGAVIQMAVAYGLWNHRKWAFITAIPVYGLCLIGSAKSVIGAILSLAIVVYAIVRLTGNIGPRPV